MRWVKVWDAPTRLFHWGVVLLLIISWVSQDQEWMSLHLLSGYCVMALLLFRLGWGVVGSETSRFARFLRSPVAALQHLRHLPRRELDTEVGHNAAGGWMVLVLVTLLCLQVATGLCANDDVVTQGPLADWVGKANSDWLSGIHAWVFTLIECAVGLHVLTVLVYAVVKRQDLVRPMLSGWKWLPETVHAPTLRGPILAGLVLAIAGAAVFWVTRLG